MINLLASHMFETAAFVLMTWLAFMSGISLLAHIIDRSGD